MANEYGEYLNYRINNAQTNKEREYYETLKALNSSNQTSPNSYTPITSNTAYVPQNTKNTTTTNYKDIHPTTVQNDKSLQDDIKGDYVDDDTDNTKLNINNTQWGGMAKGGVEHNSTQSPNWIYTIPLQYRRKAAAWANNQGIIEIIPRQQRQKYTYSTIAYIAMNQNEPKTQRFPVSDVTVTPHQINFDFYDTTEGRIGVSHATEKHMTVEFDVFLTDYVFYGWNIGDNTKNQYYLNLPQDIKKNIWQSIHDKTYTDKHFIEDIERTTEFTTFRNTFLQQHLGWLCDFNSHIFGRFTGVINDVSFQINSGESFAKWHIKLEEAIFTDEGYSKEGQKPEVQTSQNASTSDSGTATDIEDISTT